LDMGEPVKIVDLAKNLIHLSGYTEEEIDIRYNGIRPGEKMYEELLGEDEVLPGQVFEKIYVGRPMEVTGQIIQAIMERNDTYEKENIKNALMNIVLQEAEQMTAVES